MNVYWPFGVAVPCWDTSLLADVLTGKVWPVTFGPATVVVASGSLVGGSAQEEQERFQQAVEALPDAVVVHTSDEGQAHPWTHRWPAYSQYWNPDTPLKDATPILLGPPPGTREALRQITNLPPSDRLLWAFSGQAQNHIRQACVEALVSRPDGEGILHVSNGFLKGLPRERYLNLLAQAAIAPCPAGNVSPDTMRLYEALEAGCLPICNRRFEPGWPNTTNYWKRIAGFEPFPCVDNWSELPALLDHYKADPLALLRDTNRATAWWISYKRHLAHEFAFITGGSEARVSILMPTSIIPDHPSTATIEESIRRVRAYPGLERAEIIIMVDGVREEQQHRAADFEEYKRRLIQLCNWHPDFAGCYPLVFDEFTHQANMARRALELVRTPLVFYVEHDTWPAGALDFPAMLATFDDPRVNVIRLSIFDGIIPEHAHLFPDGPSIPVADGGRLVPTVQWSQRPHLARTAKYREWIDAYFGTKAKTMVEDTMTGVVSTRVRDGLETWEQWGIYLYAPAEGKWVRSETSDGRKQDPKFPMIWAYDMGTPHGAPAPGRR